jgi:hypothetical protein
MNSTPVEGEFRGRGRKAHDAAHPAGRTNEKEPSEKDGSQISFAVLIFTVFDEKRLEWRLLCLEVQLSRVRGSL